MIEADIKKIIETQNKIIESQKSHEDADIEHFAKLPTTEQITETITTTIKAVVNGKIDDVRKHLEEQDKVMKSLGDKIDPIDYGKKWLYSTGKVILYIGSLALAVVGIIKLLELIK